MKSHIEQLLKEAVKKVFGIDAEIEVKHTKDSKFGDFQSNIAFKLVNK